MSTIDASPSQIMSRQITSDQPILSILILTHNEKDFLRACLEAIRAKVSCAHEVVLLDNGSSDQSYEYVRENFPWVQIFRSEKNLGFTAGMNRASNEARGEYFLLLNNDTVLLTDVAPALELLRRDKNIGIVGAEMYGRDMELRPSTGRFPTPMRLWIFKRLWTKPKVPIGPQNLNSFKVDWVEGSFLLTTRENWHKLGGLDEGNFLYGDDFDFCRSTEARGLHVAHCKDVKYVHFGGYKPSRLPYLYFGFRKYHRKFSKPWQILTADLVLRVGLLGRIIVFACCYALTRQRKFRDKLERCLEVNRTWDQNTPPTREIRSQQLQNL